MNNPPLTPVGAICRGLAAAGIGILAMDLLWYGRYRRGGGESGFLGWELSAGLDSWEKASAPAKVGKQIYEGFFQRELPADYAALTNNLMHWGYGLTWGALYGVAGGSMRTPPKLLGPLFGALVWATSYVVLPLAKVYKPIWEYDARTLWDDLSAHLVYGTATGAAFGKLR